PPPTPPFPSTTLFRSPRTRASLPSPIRRDPGTPGSPAPLPIWTAPGQDAARSARRLGRERLLDDQPEMFVAGFLLLRREHHLDRSEELTSELQSREKL